MDFMKGKQPPDARKKPAEDYGKNRLSHFLITKTARTPCAILFKRKGARALQVPSLLSTFPFKQILLCVSLCTRFLISERHTKWES